MSRHDTLLGDGHTRITWGSAKRNARSPRTLVPMPWHGGHVISWRNAPI